MEKWLIQAKKADFNRLGNKFNISPVIARIIRNRDIISEEEFKEYLNADIEELYSPFLLKGMEETVRIIVAAINDRKKIRVIGDYDIDGICSGYILTTGIERLGGIVDFDVPERIVDGYGLNERLIRKAYNDGIELIITCDNGIAASAQVKLAKQLGINIVVTDHHEVPFEITEGGKKYILPEADAVIDQKQPDCTYPFKELCGAGITYKVIDAIYESVYLNGTYTINVANDVMRTENLMPKEEFMREFLVFAAIATVGDIVDLVSENRTIVKNGLKHINDIDNKGLKALIEANELTGKVINSYHISFIIGPCINAGGRLDTARKAFELFRCTSEKEAVIKAVDLKNINDERKDMTAFYTEKALDILKNDDRYSNQNVIVVYLPDCHESLAGIIAGRIKEIYYKPVFVLTDCEEGVKGSGRSIEGYSMYEEMVKADTRFRQENATDEHLFIKYGGHKMAAGLSIDKDRIDIFREYLNSSDGITEDMLVEKVWIDVALPFEYLSFDFIEQLDILEPFGRANERPVFAEKCRINRIRVFGKNRNVISLSVRNEAGTTIDATCFEEEEVFMGYLENKFSKTDVDNALNGRENNIRLSIIYYPEINEYRGFKNIRVVIKRYS
ncbi:MAG: single-stranded-DNA-specific exonuclease RecJ [Lachnospiraceae bacterium]|nr:single-stranded-DNA-specific exonuclease RecJ [Lachnospiraceae bacterium]